MKTYTVVHILIACSFVLSCSGSKEAEAASLASAKPTVDSLGSVIAQKKSSNADNNGPKSSPFVVEFAPTSVLKVDPVDKTEKVRDFWSSEWFVVYLTAALAVITALLAWFTWSLYSATVDLGRDAKRSGEEQGNKMGLSIAEATRAATAMEGIMEATRGNALLLSQIHKKQMRAYLSVDTGRATYQDENNNFAAGAVLANSGFTPARNVCYNVNASIMNLSDVRDFQFAGDVDRVVNDTSLGPRQRFVINGIVRGRYSENEIAEVMRGIEKQLFVWGTISYEDIFGDTWHTNFCHQYRFYKIGEEVKIQDFYYQRHNSGT